MDVETQQTTPAGPGVAENIIFGAESFFTRHKSRIFGGAFLVVVMVAGVGAWWWSREMDEEAAQIEVARAANPEDLLKVADNHPGTSAAAEALLRHGDISVQSAQWEAAARSFNRFLELFPKHALAPNALMGLGAAYEEMQRFPDGETSYRRVFEGYRQSHRAAEARLALGELLQAQGREREAREAFEALTAVNPQSVWVQSARRAIEAIDRKTGPAPVPPAAAPVAAPAAAPAGK